MQIMESKIQAKSTANDPDCNVYIANLPHDYGKNRLHTLFNPFGSIIRHKFVAPANQKEPAYGFVQFADRMDAQKAIQQLQNYKFPNGQTIYISLALHRRSSLSEEPTNLYVKNVPSAWTNATLQQTFSKYGTIRQCKIIKDGIAFVRYNDHNQALNAIDGTSGYQGLSVSFATRKTAATSYQSQQISSSKANQNNLYVRNLPSSYTQKQLEELFKPYGTICAAKLNNKGIAFVRFVHAKDALNVINKLHGTKPNGFDQELVVKLAHFDIGDCRNRLSAKVAASTMSPKTNQIQNKIAATATSNTNTGVNFINNGNMMNQNMVSAAVPVNHINMLHTMNFNVAAAYPSILPMQPMHNPMGLNSVNNLNTVNNVPVQVGSGIANLNNFGLINPMVTQFPLGAQMGYIVPQNLLNMPTMSMPSQIPSVSQLSNASQIASVSQMSNVSQIASVSQMSNNVSQIGNNVSQIPNIVNNNNNSNVVNENNGNVNSKSE